MEREVITDYKLLLDTAVLAGQIMLQNGAEIFRVEDTIHRILSLANFKTAEAYVTSTGLIATLDDPSCDSMTVVRRIHKRGTNLNCLHLANEISRELCEGRCSLKEAFHELKHMKGWQYPLYLQYGCVILSAAMFAAMLGGSRYDTLGAGITAVFLVLGMYLGVRIGFNEFMQTLSQSMIIALVAMAIVQLSDGSMDLEKVITGSIMPILPGAALTTAVRDTLQGDYLAGISKMLEAVVRATAIVVGIGLMMLMGGAVLI